MSSSPPYGPGPQPEYLDGAPVPSERRRGGTVLVGAVVGVLAAAGLGGWAAFSLLSGSGDQPAEAVPSNAAGYVSVDLDPSAGQKIEAFRMLRKFPAIADELGLETTDDLRRLFFENALDSEDMCGNLDYDADVAPWIGDRIALAAVPSDKADGEPAPMVALQVSDTEAATGGLKQLFGCSGLDTYGYAVSGDYVVVTKSFPLAEKIASDAASLSLADNEAFQEWTAAVGDPGIVTMYAAASAPQVMFDLQEELFGGTAPFGGPLGLMGPGATLSSAGGVTAGEPAMTDRMREMYRDFEGMAGVLRFTDGAVEIEMATRGMPAGLTPTGPAEGTPIGRLPGSTAGALAIAFPDGWLTEYVDTMSTYVGEGQGVEEMLAEAEAATGLSLPEDVETLLGDGLALAVDVSLDPAVMERPEGWKELPVGVVVSGEPDEILTVVDKIRAAVGIDGDMVLAEPGDGVVAFGVSRAYVDRLVTEGSLSSDAAFERVVPSANDASAVGFVNFDAGDGWLERLAESDGDSETAANLAPLEALGMSAWSDDDATQHGLVRLTVE